MAEYRDALAPWEEAPLPSDQTQIDTSNWYACAGNDCPVQSANSGSRAVSGADAIGYAATVVGGIGWLLQRDEAKYLPIYLYSLSMIAEMEGLSGLAVGGAEALGAAIFFAIEAAPVLVAIGVVVGLGAAGYGLIGYFRGR
jgi:hypothetical protein